MKGLTCSGWYAPAAWRIALVLGVAAGSAAGAGEPAAAAKATSSKAAREEALRAIPFEQLSEHAKVKLNGVVQHASLYRHLPTETVDCDTDLHSFLVRHPEVVVDIWDVLDISKVSMQKTGPNTYRAGDGSGTTGNIEYLYSDPGLQVIYADGMYDGPLFARKVRGECVLVLRSEYVRQANGRLAAIDRLDLFVKLDSIGMEFIVKTFQPLINRCAEANFSDTTAFIGTLTKAAEHNPDGIDRLANKLRHVDPATRDEFARVATSVPERAEAQAAVARAAAPRRGPTGSNGSPLPR